MATKNLTLSEKVLINNARNGEYMSRPEDQQFFELVEELKAIALVKQISR